MADPIDAIRAEASRIEAEAAAAARGHEAAAKPWRRLSLWLGLPIAVLAAAAGVSTFSDHPVTAGILEVIVAIGTALVAFMSPGERHLRHDEACHGYEALRNDARIFREVECAVEADPEDLAEQLRGLNQRRNHLNGDSPALAASARGAAAAGAASGARPG
ncbi:MAG TPA: SLATT domain-containing protein [Opitutaceae bacterium]|nr:SLATT domain-containing protein [Opitutaceae bacterium]